MLRDFLISLIISLWGKRLVVGVETEKPCETRRKKCFLAYLALRTRTNYDNFRCFNISNMNCGTFFTGRKLYLRPKAREKWMLSMLLAFCSNLLKALFKQNKSWHSQWCSGTARKKSNHTCQIWPGDKVFFCFFFLIVKA